MQRLQKNTNYSNSINILRDVALTKKQLPVNMTLSERRLKARQQQILEEE
jgi:hypothetical protein